MTLILEGCVVEVPLKLVVLLDGEQADGHEVRMLLISNAARSAAIAESGHEEGPR
jgi:hypothetical protein